MGVAGEGDLGEGDVRGEFVLQAIGFDKYFIIVFINYQPIIFYIFYASADSG